MDNDNLEQTSPPVEWDQSFFRNGNEARNTDVFILLMGLTGTGKSSLISHLASGAERPLIGHGSLSCTHDTKVYHYAYLPDTNVYLIDTPGFNDSNRSDNEVLSALAAWITAASSNGIHLHCVLYLHRITDYRVSGTGMRNLQMFKGMCGDDGDDAWRKVIFVTTMWELIREDIGQRRETELASDSRYWEPMLRSGSRTERHERDDEASARRLVGIAVQVGQDAALLEVPLALQREYAMQNRSLVETRAAQATLHHREQRRQQLTRQNEELENKIRRAEEARNTELQTHLETEKATNDRALENLRRETEYLSISAEGLLDLRFGEGPQEGEAQKQARLEQTYPKPESYASITRDHAPIRRISIPTADRPGNPPNTRRKPISLSMRGRHAAFIGPGIARTYLPEPTRNSFMELERNDNIRIKRIALGEGQSYFAHYDKGNIRTKCYYAGKVKSKYPGLYDFLSRHGNTACPEALSLGPEGSYFISVQGRRSLQCHPDASINGPAATNASRLWWGVGGSYVLENRGEGTDRSLTWELRGGYGELGVILEKRKGETGIKELALNIEDNTSFVLVLECGSVFYNIDDVMVSDCWEGYATKMFGHLSAS